MRFRLLAFTTLFLILPAIPSWAAHGPLTIRTLPRSPILERGRDQQLLNFDLVIANSGTDPLRLQMLQVEAFDGSGVIITRKGIDTNGFPSSMETIPERDVAAHGVLGVFNPLYAWTSAGDIARLRYLLTFSDEHTDSLQYATINVYPRVYQDRTVLSVPLKGRLFVVDGHDFYAHHRRQDISAPEAAQAGVTANPMRYALDLAVVNARGEMYHGDSREKRNWYGYGAPVYAPGSGVVVALVNDVPESTWDGKRLHKPRMPADASPFELGNYVVIDHRNGEYSALLHLIPQSIRVRLGDRVTQGEVLGRLGASDSGDPTYPVAPHLHYCLISGRDFARSEGLPAFFARYTLLLGQKRIREADQTIDTGDFLTNP